MTKEKAYTNWVTACEKECDYYALPFQFFDHNWEASEKNTNPASPGLRAAAKAYCASLVK